MQRAHVLEKIEVLIASVISELRCGQSPAFHFSSRRRANTRFDSEQHQIVLKNTNERHLVTVSLRIAPKQFATYVKVLNTAHHLLIENIHLTKRDLYYSDVNFFKSQKRTDLILDNLACMLSIPRDSLHIVATERGLVAGPLVFRYRGHIVNCNFVNAGHPISPFEELKDITANANYVLLIEKEATFLQLAGVGFHHKYKCILISGRGYPDIATRSLLRYLATELCLPVLALVDCDPHGIEILLTYVVGSVNLAYHSGLSTSSVAWLGVHVSDLQQYGISEETLQPLTTHDIVKAQSLLQSEALIACTKWWNELWRMLQNGKKAELQCLSSLSFSFLSEVYLPDKIQRNQWLTPF